MTDEAGPQQKNLDHIVPHNIGGTWTHGNVRVICRTCNLTRPKDGTDLAGHQATLWATDHAAAEVASALRVKRVAQPKKPNTHKILAEARRLSKKITADLAYLYRIEGHTWKEILLLWACFVGHALIAAWAVSVCLQHG